MSLAERFPHASASFLRLNGAAPFSQRKLTAPQKTTMPYAAPRAKPTMRQNRTGMNKTEAEFDAYLRADDSLRHVVREGVALRLANGVRYTPDFIALAKDENLGNWSHVHCYEVKGFMRDDAAAKLKIAASLFPYFRFFLVKKTAKKHGGGWLIEEVLP